MSTHVSAPVSGVCAEFNATCSTFHVCVFGDASFGRGIKVPEEIFSQREVAILVIPVDVNEATFISFAVGLIRLLEVKLYK